MYWMIEVIASRELLWPQAFDLRWSSCGVGRGLCDRRRSCDRSRGRWTAVVALGLCDRKLPVIGVLAFGQRLWFQDFMNTLLVCCLVMGCSRWFRLRGPMSGGAFVEEFHHSWLQWAGLR